MSETLYLLRHERDEDGHLVKVYQDARGRIERVTVFPTVEYLQHQTKVLAATEDLLIQRARTEMAAAELQDVRDHLAARRKNPLQIENVTDLRRLPSPKQNGG